MSSSNEIEGLGVYQIFTGDGTGSGFLIDPQHLLTNAHVVSPYRSVGVEMRDKRRVVGRVRRLHPKRDLAIVEVPEPLDGIVLPFAPGEELRSQQALRILGFPVGLPLSVTEGVVSHTRQLLDGQYYVQTDAAVNPGNSGGPMLDESNRIVAVTTCTLRSADLVSFGIPVADAARFVNAFREQASEFGVECPACEALLESAKRYCDDCGSDLDNLDLDEHFEPPEQHPVVAFVEEALVQAKVDPVLARHGRLNWSFYSGSAPIKIWCCCSEHVCFSSPLAQPGKRSLGDLFRYLLSPEHEPLAFDLDDNVIRLNLTIHMSDVFTGSGHDILSKQIAEFVRKADDYDNALIDRFECLPAPETQLTFLKEGSH